MSRFDLWSVAVRALLSAACGLVIVSARAGAQATGTALVRHAPSLNGTVEGSVQQMLPESVTLNGGARVTGDLFVPGTPNVVLNGSVNYGGTLNGTGTATPTNYQVMLNGNVTLGHVVRRTNAVTLPTVAAPPNPAGTRNVTINTAGQSPGAWSTLKNLILNGNTGNYDVPAGTYGDFTVNGGSSITLGVPGATQPSAYNFQRLTLNGNAQFRVVGPVIVTVKNAVTANGAVGLASNPSWLTLRISAGGLTLNGTVSAYGHVAAPSGTVIINGNTQLVGGVECDRLTVNGNGFLRLFPFQAANQPPVATAPSAALTTNEDTGLPITLAGSDPENAPLTYIVVSGPANGTLTPPAGGGAARSYQPAANFSGSDSFTFKVNDGALDSALVTVPITVLPINDPPEADAKSIVTPEDTAAEITLSGLDLETPAALTFAVTAQPAHGTLSTLAGGAVTYTPALNYHGSDSFAYVANDGALNSFPATVSITVEPRNDAPEAVARTITVEEEGEVTFALTGIDVDDPSGAGLTFEIIDEPDHGARSGVVPEVTYAPADNFAATDMLTFRVYDGEAWSAPATITIVVTNLNDTPTANDQPVTVNEDAAVAFTVTGADVDGDTITFAILTGPQHGTVAAGGVPVTEYPFEGLVDGTLIYSPGGNYAGADQFTFRTHDGSADSAPATVSFTIHPINDAPTANSQQILTDEDQPAEVTLTGDDLEGDSLQFIITVEPQHGALTPIVPGASVFTYQPAANYFGPDSFTFKTRDAELDSTEVVVAITVNPVNDAPAALPGTAATDEDTAVELALGGADVDHAPAQLTFAIVTQPAFGTLAPAAGVGGFTYQPNPNYHGDDSFTFTVGDGEFTSPAATFVLVVRPINDPPEVANLSLETFRGQALPLALNAIDVDGDALTYAVGSPQNGTLDPTSPGGPERTYAPTAGFAGADSFSFTVSDGIADPVAGTVAIQVINRAPVADSAPLGVTEDVAESLTLTGSDPESDALIFTIVDQPLHGTLSPLGPPSALNTFTYTPALNNYGADSLTFTVSDGALESTLATITITIDPVNDAPDAQAAAFSTDEDVAVIFALAGTDVEASSLTFIILGEPAHGTVTPPSGGGDFTYTAAPNFHGEDTFTFIAHDGDLDSAPVTVAITVAPTNDSPGTADLAITTFANQPAAFTLAGTDVDGDALSFTVNAPQHGSVVPSSGGPAFTYVPLGNYVGNDSATFTVSDGFAPPVSGTLAITIVNRVPSAFDTAVTVTEDTPTPIVLSAIDPDGQPLSYAIIADPQHGTLAPTLSPSTFTFTPAANYDQTDSFTFRANDGYADSNTATIAIDMVPVNDAPSFAAANPADVPANSALVEVAGWAMFSPGPSSEDGQAVVGYTISAVSNPGLFSVAPTVDSAGTLRFQPGPGVIGESSFTIVVQDDGGAANGGTDVSAPQTLVIRVVTPPRSKTWTSTEDFLNAELANVTAANDEAFLATDTRAFNFLWVPITSKGTIVRIDADTGQVLGEYRTAPAGQATNPSRTSVASDGSVWVGNRHGNTVTHVGVPGNGAGASLLTTSRGLGDVLDWKNLGGADTGGGVSTAADDLIRHYVPVRSSGIRHLSVDPNDNVWVSGTGSRVWDLVDGATGTIIRQEPSVGWGGYGGLIDGNGILWSTRPLFRWDTNLPLSDPTSWRSYNLDSYGTSIDPFGYVWVAQLSGGTVAKFDAAGDLVGLFQHGSRYAQGVVADNDGDIWVAHSLVGSRTVGHLKNDGTFVGNVVVGSNPTGVAVDAKGRVWAALNGGIVKRIDRHAGPLGADGVTPVGEVDLETDYLGGSIYAYSDMTGSNIIRDPDLGQWTADFDSEISGALWAPVSWIVESCNHASVAVSVATSEDGVSFSAPHVVTLADPAVPLAGRHIRVTVDFQRAPSGGSPILREITVGTQGFQAATITPSLDITAGPDIVANWPDTYALRGALCTNGFPFTGVATFAWELLGGPGTATFSDATAAHTELEVSDAGTYLVSLTVIANGVVRSDTVSVELTPYNRAPWVDAGPKIYALNADAPVGLDGYVRDDGLPLGVTLQSEWRQVHGPEDVSFANQNDPATNAFFPAPGIYILELTASDTEFTRSERLEVRVGTPCSVNHRESLTTWWPANGTITDVVRGNGAELRGGATYGDGRVSMGFQFTGSGQNVRIGAHPSADVGSFADGFTIEFWVRPTTSDTRLRRLMAWANAAGEQLRVVTRTQAGEVQLIDPAGRVFVIGGVGANTWSHVVIAYDATTKLLRGFSNGNFVAQADASAWSFTSSADLWLAGHAWISSLDWFAGGLDEVSFYDRPLQVGEVLTLAATGSVGKCPPSDNEVPIVNAGPDLFVRESVSVAQLLGELVNLSLDDVEVAWKQVSGPIPAEIVSPAAIQPVVNVSQPGLYVFDITATTGYGTDTDMVEVRVADACSAEPAEGLLAWWSANSTTEDNVSGAAAAGLNATYGPGQVGDAFAFDGSDRYVLVPAGAQTDLSGQAAGFTIEFWARRPDLSPSRRYLIWGGGASLQTSNGANLMYLNFGNGANTYVADFNPSDGWVHMAYVYDRVQQRLRTYRDGLLQRDDALVSGSATGLNGDLYFGGTPSLSASQRCNGGLDEVSFYDRPLTGPQISTIYHAGSAGKCPPSDNQAPLVSAGPDLQIFGSDGLTQLLGQANDDGRPVNVLSLQWTQEFGPLAEIADATHAQTLVSVPEPGLYVFRLTATDGYASRSDVMELRVGAACAAEPDDGLLAWWSGNSTAEDTVGGTEAGGLNVTYGPGQVGNAFAFDGSDRYVLVPAGAQTDLSGQAAGFTIEFWARRADFAVSRRYLIWSGGGRIQISNGADLMQLVFAGGSGSHVSSIIPSEGWVHMAYVYDRVQQRLRTYRDGLLNTDVAMAGSSANGLNGDLYFGGTPSLSASQRCNGGLDEVSFYDRPLTGPQISTIFHAGSVGKCPPSDNQAPLVSAGPDLQIFGSDGLTQLLGQANDDGRPLNVLSLQWTQEFGPLAEIADATHAQTLVTVPEPGLYVFRLTATDGYASRSDVMEVRVGAACAAEPDDGLLAWWSGNSTAEDTVGGTEAGGLNVTYGPGQVGNAFAFDGSDRYVLVPAGAQTDLSGQAAGFTIEFWARRADFAVSRRYLIWSGGGRMQISNGADLMQLVFAGGSGSHVSSIVPSDGWVHMAFAYDRVQQRLRSYRNGLLNTDVAMAGSSANGLNGDLYFGGTPSLSASQRCNGGLDEVSFYDRSLTGLEISAIFNAGTAGKCPIVHNTAPSVNVSAGGTVPAGTPLALDGLVLDDGLPNPPGVLTYTWSKVSGPGEVTFTAAATATSAATFSAAGTYVVRLTVSDSELTASDDISVVVIPPPPSVTVTSPVDATQVVANRAVTISATAAYTGGPIVKVEFFDGATKLGESTTPSAPDTYSFNVAGGFALGTHVLSARVTAVDGASATSAPVTITATTAPPPSVAIIEPVPGATLVAGIAAVLRAQATTTDGSITKVEFFRDGVKIGEATGQLVGQPDVYGVLIGAGFTAGNHSLTARATGSNSTSTVSAPVAITVVADPGVDPDALIASPADGSRIPSPTTVTGVVVSPILASWQLAYRLKAADGAVPAAWVSLATGATNIGTPASGSVPAVPGTLGTFDPTLLLNGIYELRLSATDYAGVTAIDGPITVVVDGNMKVGAFSLAFEDLNVPVAGIPISITRTYDSRDARVGDFGPGWNIAVNNIRVQKNRHLGRDWWQTPTSGVPQLQFFDVLPIDERVVTVVFPDGETHRFRAGAFVSNRVIDPDYSSWGVLVREGRYRFYPLGDTTSTLEPLDASNQLAEAFWLQGTGDQDLYIGNYLDTGPDGFPVDFNPTRFRLTTKDGSVFIVDERLGLLEMHDLTGNSLVLGRDAQNRVTSIVSTPAPSTLAPAPTSVITIHRDATGRVDFITDLVGESLDYTYDAQGRLESFTDRALNVTQFRYEHPAFAHYLTKIIDPRGIAALRSEYDASGRLVKQIDADGRETIFNRGLDATGRFERIEDRLGHETTYYYDERGNVTLKIDPLGAQTTFSYYADTDRVRFEVDHYGNTKSFAYDARGNVTVETLGASLGDDPANPTSGFVTRTSYNNLSAPTQLTDPDGRVQTFTYQPGTSNLLTHTAGTGTLESSTSTFTYNGDGTISTITDAVGNVTSNTYTYGFSDVAFPGAVKRISVTVTDPAGAAGSDPANPSDTVLRTSRTLYDAQENAIAEIATRTLPNGSSEDIVTRHRYDAENRLVATILPDGRVNETRYTSFGKEDKSVQWRSLADYESGNDTLARITSYTYDARGNQTAMSCADGASESVAFDEENRKLWSQDRRGYRTFFEYDAVGRLTSTIAPDDNDGVGAAAPGALADPRLSDNARTTTIYDLIGRVRFQIDEEGATTEFTYEDNCGCAMRRKEMIQHLPTGNLVTSYAYDNAGNVRFVTDPRGHTVETQYDAQGRPATVVHPASDEHPATQTSTIYDVLGRRVAMTDQEGKLTRYRYDGLGRLVEVRQYLDQSLASSDAAFSLSPTASGVVATTYAYDEAGNQTAQTDALGRTTRYETDALGRRTRRILPLDPSDSAALSETLGYDIWGNLETRTDFAGKTTTFGYDALNRLKSKSADPTHPSLSGGSAIARIEYDYDTNGVREAARTYGSASNLIYSETTPHDPRGRLAAKQTAGGTLDYSYFENGLLQDVVSSNARGVNIGYRYDALNRLAHVDDATTGTVRTSSYTYNPNGSIDTVTYANNVRHAYQYDALNRLRFLTASNLPSQILRTQEYRLRASGHRREVLEGPAPSGPFKTNTYEYDALYRLTGETVAGSSLGNNGAISYTLDKVGNRTSRITTGAELQLKLPTSTSSYNARDWLDSDDYDANGNTLAGVQPAAVGLPPAVADTYDFENRVVRRTRADGSTVHLNYDADGNRIQKVITDAASVPVSVTNFLVDTNNLTGYAQVVEERTTNGGGTSAVSSLKTYTYGGDLVSQSIALNSQPSTLNFFSYDGHGSVRELTDETGAITDRYDYDAFGVLIRSEAYGPQPTANSYLYCGEQWDSDLGLYVLRARFMNPHSGRFWNADAYEGRNNDPTSLHRYLYASANPVSYWDPSGNFSLFDVQIAASEVGLLAARVAIPAIGRFLLWNYSSVPRGVVTAAAASQLVMAYTAYYVGPTALALENFGESQMGRKNYPRAIELFQAANEGYSLVFKTVEHAFIAPARAAVLGKIGMVMALFKAGQGIFGLFEYKEKIFNLMSRLTGVPIQLVLENMSVDGFRRLAVDTFTMSAQPWVYVELAQEAYEAKQDGDFVRAAMATQTMMNRLARYQ